MNCTSEVLRNFQVASGCPAAEDRSKAQLTEVAPPEIEEAIQETNAQLQALIEDPLFVTAEELAQRERDFKCLTDRLQGLHAAWQLQQQLASEELRKTERPCAAGMARG